MENNKNNPIEENWGWPEKNDNLFVAGDDWKNNACLNWSHSEWELYTIGYKEAADNLSRNIMQSGTDQDTLIYPIVFLYRHYLELVLKSIIMRIQLLNDEKLKIPSHHKLEPLWSDCKKAIKNILKREDIKYDIKPVNDAIIQFSGIDNKSMTFRYPVSKELESLIPSDLKYINIRNLFEIMQKISNFFEIISIALGNDLEFKREMESYFGPDTSDFY